MRPRQIWFGEPERPLAGRYYLPEDATVRGGVVICPALGMEAACSAPALRELAARLCVTGLGVLFFDYDGTGDSSGSDEEPERLAAWQGSVNQALEFLRQQGHTWRAVIGLRMGALLAADALARAEDVDAVVLWDPCMSGRSFLREQQLLLRTFSHEPDLGDGYSYGPGVSFTPETASALRELSLSTASAGFKAPVLLLTREGASDAGSLAKTLSRRGLDWKEIAGQFELVGVEPALAQIPHDTLMLIDEWMSTHATDVSKSVGVPASSRALLETTASGDQIWEYPVLIGEDELFGIVTESPGGAISTPVIFLNAGVLDHVGPSRLWVELSRRWAALGVRTLRFDISGVGESPYRAGMNERVTRSVHGLRQVQEAISMMSPQDASNVVLVGLCSGAYQSMEAGLANKVRAILMVNPAFRINPLLEPSSRGESPPRELAETPKRWYRVLEHAKPLVPLARRAPDFVWRLVNRFGIEGSKADSLVRIAAAGIDALVVTDPQEAAAYVRGQKARLRDLSRDGRFTMVVIDPLDHTVFGPLARRRVADALSKHLETKIFDKSLTSSSGEAMRAKD